MTTLSTFTTGIVRDLKGTEGTAINTLNGAITTTATSLTVTYAPTGAPGGFGVGSRLQIEDELVYVLAISSSTATVIRGMDGSTAVQHSSGVQVLPAPRWPNIAVHQAAKDEIRSWQTVLFKVASVSFTVSVEGERAWDWTPTDALFLLHADFFPTTAPDDLRGQELRSIEIRSGQLTSQFASGKAFVVGDTLSDETGTVRVTYAAEFDLSTFTGSTDLESTVGIPDTTVDLLKAGVKWRLLADQEASRSNLQAQGEARLARDVEVGAAAGQSEVWRRIRERRLGEEALNQMRDHPYRMSA